MLGKSVIAVWALWPVSLVLAIATSPEEPGWGQRTATAYPLELATEYPFVSGVALLLVWLVRQHPRIASPVAVCTGAVLLLMG